MTFTAFVFRGVMLPVLLLLYHVCARGAWKTDALYEGMIRGNH